MTSTEYENRPALKLPEYEPSATFERSTGLTVNLRTAPIPGNAAPAMMPINATITMPTMSNAFFPFFTSPKCARTGRRPSSGRSPCGAG